MSEQQPEQLIPPLHADDLFNAERFMLEDGDLFREYQRIKQSDPRLALAILGSAFDESVDERNIMRMKDSLRLRMGIVIAIEESLRRQKEVKTTPNGDGGEGSQPSGE